MRSTPDSGRRWSGLAANLLLSLASIAVTLHRTRNQLKKELSSTGAPS